jgi:hypothetical protein
MSLAEIIDALTGGADAQRQPLARLRRDGGPPILLELGDPIAAQDVASA